MRNVVLAVLVAGVLLYAVGFNGSSSAAEPELRPSQVAMRARAGWLKNMSEHAAAQKLHGVKGDAMALAAQTKAMGEKQEDPLARELTLKVSGLASDVADAVVRKDPVAVTAKLAEIKATCAECHAKIRDKK